MPTDRDNFFLFPLVIFFWVGVSRGKEISFSFMNFDFFGFIIGSNSIIENRKSWEVVLGGMTHWKII